LGSTKYKRVSPIVFIARAADPMLPGWLGDTKIILILLSMGASVLLLRT